MSCIHYKFKTTLDYRSISFDGVALSLADLKKAIFQQRRMKPGEIDLEITNAQTKEVYKSNDDMIPKNSSVIVARVPIPTSTKNNTSKSWEAFKQECARAMKEEKEKERAAQELANQQAGDIANAKTSEIDKIRAMMNQSGRDFDPASYKNKVPLGQPPVGYKCYKCGKGGHYIHGCTEKSESNVIEPKFKRSTGIPNSFLTLTDDPTVPGALLTYSGKFAVPTIDKHAYATGKKELPPFLPGVNTQAVVPKSPGIPQELRCLICQDLLKDAVLIPCCGNSFCDDCIRNKLLETEDHECPICHEQDVSPDKLIPNKLMRKAVINFLNESGYTNVINKSVERMKEERRSASPTLPPAPTPPVQAPQVQKPVQTQRPVNIRQAWQQYKKPAYNNQVIQTLTPSQPNVIPSIVPVTQQVPSIQPAAHHFTNTISSVNRVVNDAVPVQAVTRSQPPPPMHMASTSVQSVNSPILSQHSERSNTPEDRAPTPVKDEQPNPPGVDEAAVNVISVVGQPPPEVQTVQAVQTTRSSTVPSWQNLKAPGSNTPPLYGSLPATTSNSHPSSLLGGPPPIYPGMPGPMIGQPITPMNFGLPPFGPGPRPPFPPFAPPVAPMSKEQFYREQKRMKEAAKEKKYDVMDHFTKDFLERKDRVKKTKSKSKSRSRSRSKTPRRSRSRTPRRLRSLTPRRSRSRSRPPRSLTPIRKRSRSRTPYRSRSRSRSPPPRLRSRSRSRSRYRSRSRSRYRSRSRSFARSLSRGRYRSYSRSPIRSYRRYSRSRSRSPYRRYSPVRRRSPIGSRRRSLTPPGKYSDSRRWSPRPGARYGNDSPGRYSPPPRYPPDYGFSGPPGPPPFRFDGPPPPHFFGNPPGYGIGPRPPIGPPGMPVGLPPPPPPGFGMYPAPPVPTIRNRSRSPKRHGRPLMGTPPRGRYDHDRPRDRKDYGTDRTSDRPRTHDDKGRYQRDGHGRKDYPKTQDGVRSHDKERNSQTSDLSKTSKDKKGKEDKENKENGKGLKSDEKTEKEKSKEKGESKSKKKKESKKKEKSEKKKRDKSKDKKKVETDTSGDVYKNEEKKDSTKVSTGNTYARSSNSTLIFLTGGGDEAPENSEANTVANTAETTTDTTNVKKVTESSPAKEIKKIKKVKKRTKSSNVAEDTSDSTTENKSRTRSSKKAAALVEYNETSGDVSDKPPKKKGTSKKGKAKVKPEDSKQEDEETPSKDPDGIETKVEKENDEVATLVNRAPPSPHDQFPSSPMDATDGVHEDEPSPPGVNDKPDLLLDKPELMLDLPELSKWERDDIDEESEEEPQKIEVKKSLPKSVIEKAEKALTQKPPKISSVASAITSPVRNTAKKRRVYLDDGEDEKKPVESYEDNRRVHTKQKSMQITISSKDKQRNEELERREIRKGDKSRQEEKRDREPERKSVFTRMKLDDHDRNSDKYKDRRDRESRSSFEDSGNRKDRESRKIKDLREKLPNRTDRRDHERFEEKRERHREKPSRKHSDSNHKDNDIGKGSSDKLRKVNSKSVKDQDNHSDQEINETRNPNEKTESKSKPVIDRKESLLDESLFEPDYNEEVSETETSSADEAPGKVQKEKEPSPSASSHESSPTPAKKRKRHDTTDDENQSKKSKHKKHKHKHKTGKHKHKKKKHKKKEQEIE